MNDTKEALIGIAGQKRVVDDAATLEAYAADQSLAPALRPWYIVKPQNTAEVEKLVQWANHTATPLVPVSSGEPRFRGDTVPSTPGAVMVDMSGMNQIIHVDKRNRMIIIEPGVTYTQLQPELAKVGLRVSPSLAPRATKSVVTNLLEKEPTLVPRYQWAALDPLRCLEIVWGDGQRMTTGEAGSLGTLEEEWAKKLAQANPAGPAQTDFYKIASAAQGSMGIVTWASVKCETLPQIHKLFLVPSRNLEPLIDLAYSILRVRFGDELLILNSWNLAAILGQEPGQIRALAEQLPPWLLLVGIAGRERLPEERVDYQEKDITEMAQRYGLQLLPAVPGANGPEVLKAILNPSREPYWKLTYKSSCQEIFFLNTLEKAPVFVKAMYTIAESHVYNTSEIGVYIQPVHQGASCHIEFDLPFDRTNPGELSRMQGLYTGASEELLKQGAYYSRPYGIWAPLAYNRDERTTTALKKLKGIFDPNNIMNPGKLCF